LGKLDLRFAYLNMIEEQIINAIADACKDDRLRYQIIIRNTVLHIYINRPTKVNLDYQRLKQQIYAVIANLSHVKFSQIWFYSRILGEIEPDWQSVLEIEASNLAADEMVSMVRTITTAVDATNLVVDKIEHELEISESFIADYQIDFEDLPSTGVDAEDLWDLSESELTELLEDSVQQFNRRAEIIPDLSQYCFIRNRRLLYAVLDSPWSKIAQLINQFDQLDQLSKRSQLPILETYFEEFINPEIRNFEPEVQAWWQEVQSLDSDNRHKLAIWLSRYCLNVEQTRATIKKVLTTQVTSPQAKQSKLEIEATANVSSPPNEDFQTSSSQQLPDQIQDSDISNSKGKLGLFRSATAFISKLFRSKS